MIFCKSCGKQLDDDAKFCGACGTAVSAPPVADSGRPVTVPQPDMARPAPAQPVYYQQPQAQQPYCYQSYPQEKHGNYYGMLTGGVIIMAVGLAGFVAAVARIIYDLYGAYYGEMGYTYQAPLTVHEDTWLGILIIALALSVAGAVLLLMRSRHRREN